MKRALTTGFVILFVASLFVFPAPAQAVPFAPVINHSAEVGAASPDGSTIVAVPGWTTTGSLTVVPYGAGAPFPSVPFDTDVSPQLNFFVGGPSATLSTATQTIAIGSPEEFEDYPGFWSLFATATLGGWRSDQVGPRVRFELLDASQGLLVTYSMNHTSSVFSINPAKPEFVESLAFGTIPPGTRFIRVTMELEGLPGQYNTSLVDDLIIGFTYPDPVESVTWSQVKKLGR